jgi:subtilisin family serine protease
VLANKDVVFTGTSAATKCPDDISECWHGTHVAGIAAGREMPDPEAPGETIAGIAHGADIIAVQIFSKVTTAEGCDNRAPPCLRSFYSSQLRALGYIQMLEQRRKEHPPGEFPHVVAINMSLGGGEAFDFCDASSPLTRPIQALKDNGLATFVASGNDGFAFSVTEPGCISDAITVGAIDKGAVEKPQREGDPPQRSVASFTNFGGGMVDMMTVGVNLLSSMPNGKWERKEGTSMATPVAAGVYTDLKSAYPALTPSEFEELVKKSNFRVDNPIGGPPFPVLDLTELDTLMRGTLTAGSSNSTSVGEDNVGTSFIILPTPGKSSAASAASIQSQAPALGAVLDAGSIGISQIEGDRALTLSTENPVSLQDLETELKSRVQGIEKVYNNRGLPPLKGGLSQGSR